MSLDPELDVAKDWTPRRGDVDLDALEALAKALIAGEARSAIFDALISEYHCDHLQDCLIAGAPADPQWEPNVGQRGQAEADADRLLRAIPAFDPQTVLALIERLRKAEQR